MFPECPLCGSVSVGVLEKLEEWDCKESFDGFGKCGGEVDAAVVVGVVSCLFLIMWCYPVKFPVVGPGVLCEHHACEDGDGECECGCAVFEDATRE